MQMKVELQFCAAWQLLIQNIQSNVQHSTEVSQSVKPSFPVPSAFPAAHASPSPTVPLALPEYHQDPSQPEPVRQHIIISCNLTTMQPHSTKAQMQMDSTKLNTPNLKTHTAQRKCPASILNSVFYCEEDKKRVYWKMDIVTEWVGQCQHISCPFAMRTQHILGQCLAISKLLMRQLQLAKVHSSDQAKFYCKQLFDW